MKISYIVLFVVAFNFLSQADCNQDESAVGCSTPAFCEDVTSTLRIVVTTLQTISTTSQTMSTTLQRIDAHLTTMDSKDAPEQENDTCACNSNPSTIAPTTANEFVGPLNCPMNESSANPSEFTFTQLQFGEPCKALANQTLDTNCYNISVDIYVPSNTTAYFFGLIYNAKDADNYDTATFSLVDPQTCYFIGYVDPLTAQNSQFGACPNGLPQVGAWFTMEMEVRGNTAKVFRDGVLQATATPYFPTKGSGGVIADLSDTLLKFRNFKITCGTSP